MAWAVAVLRGHDFGRPDLPGSFIGWQGVGSDLVTARMWHGSRHGGGASVSVRVAPSPSGAATLALRSWDHVCVTCLPFCLLALCSVQGEERLGRVRVYTELDAFTGSQQVGVRGRYGVNAFSAFRLLYKLDEGRREPLMLEVERLVGGWSHHPNSLLKLPFRVYPTLKNPTTTSPAAATAAAHILSHIAVLRTAVN